MTEARTRRRTLIALVYAPAALRKSPARKKPLPSSFRAASSSGRGGMFSEDPIASWTDARLGLPPKIPNHEWRLEKPRRTNERRKRRRSIRQTKVVGGISRRPPGTLTDFLILRTVDRRFIFSRCRLSRLVPPNRQLVLPSPAFVISRRFRRASPTLRARRNTPRTRPLRARSTRAWPPRLEEVRPPASNRPARREDLAASWPTKKPLTRPRRERMSALRPRRRRGSRAR